MSEQPDLASMTPDEIVQQFTYRLNEMEVASWADKPVEHGYVTKRQAVFDFVRQLATRAAAAQGATHG